jgi:hypothetical protein
MYGFQSSRGSVRVIDPAGRRLTPTVIEWRLQTEPWVLLIDRGSESDAPRGGTPAVFEGPAATDEIREAVELMRGAR